MLLNGDLVLGTLKNFHVLAIQGRYGGGKTALAFRLAYELLNDGTCDHLVSNVPSVWTEDHWKIDFDENRTLKTVVILDEAGIFLRTGKDTEAYLAAMRKMQVYLILPSVMPVPRRVAFYRIQREMNLQAVGLPVWMYKSILTAEGTRDEAKFYWVNPSEIFGVYDTLAMPVDDCEISDWLLEKVGKIAKRGRTKSRSRSGIDRQLSSVEVTGWDDGGISEAAEIIAEAAETISLSGQKFSKRRR